MQGFARCRGVMYHRFYAKISFKRRSQRIREMKIAIASDHAGFEEKERLKPLLESMGVVVADLGTVSKDSVDYPDFAFKVAESVAAGISDSGILVCGSGTGMAIAANKVPGIGAGVAGNEETAPRARRHTKVNGSPIGPQ